MISFGLSLLQPDALLMSLDPSGVRQSPSPVVSCLRFTVQIPQNTALCLAQATCMINICSIKCE